VQSLRDEHDFDDDYDVDVDDIHNHARWLSLRRGGK
jgi:hypothetical protein